MSPEKTVVPMEVFQSSIGEFKDDNGRDIKYSSVVARIGNAVMKLHTDIDISKFQGKEIKAQLEWRVAGKMAPKPTVVAVVEK